MNNSNPLVPQGSILEQQNKGRNRFKVAVFCVLALHIVFVGGLLMVGCKKDQHGNESAENQQLTSNIDTNAAVPPDINPPAPANNLAATTTPGTPVVPAPLPGPTAAPLPAPVPTPAPQAPEATSAVGAPSDYVVAKGDSFYTIAKKFGVSTKAIQNANPSVSPTKLKVGQKIQIPPASAASSSTTASSGTAAAVEGTSGGSTYTVKSGDTLAKIAKNNSVSIRSLRSANNLKTDRIKVGDKLKIPSKASAPAAPATDAAPVPAAPATTGAVPPLSAPAAQ
jgi:LysM repeat protein